MSGPAEVGAGRTYRRTMGTRIVSTGCALLFTGGAVSLAASDGATPGFAVLAGLALLSLCGAVAVVLLGLIPGPLISFLLESSRGLTFVQG